MFRLSQYVYSLDSISLFNALKGVIYKSDMGSGLSLNIRSITGSRAASVLPDPVGDINNILFPFSISGMAILWASVGSSMPFFIKLSFNFGFNKAKTFFQRKGHFFYKCCNII